MVGALDVRRLAKGLIYRGQGSPCRAPELPVVVNNARPQRYEIG